MMDMEKKRNKTEEDTHLKRIAMGLGVISLASLILTLLLEPYIAAYLSSHAPQEDVIKNIAQTFVNVSRYTSGMNMFTTITLALMMFCAILIAVCRLLGLCLKSIFLSFVLGVFVYTGSKQTLKMLSALIFTLAQLQIFAALLLVAGISMMATPSVYTLTYERYNQFEARGTEHLLQPLQTEGTLAQLGEMVFRANIDPNSRDPEAAALFIPFHLLTPWFDFMLFIAGAGSLLWSGIHTALIANHVRMKIWTKRKLRSLASHFRSAKLKG